MTTFDEVARDEAARQAISRNLAETLFVEAGAGSGKTTSLVERVLSLLDDGTAMENIAAITFTEKAASELRNRIRRIVQDRLGDAETSNDGGKVRHYRAALDQLDGAAITTLHGFALRILSLHAIEAGLPPHVEVSPVEEFEDRWEEIRDNLLDDPDHWETVVISRALGINASALRGLAEVFEANWDLVEDRVLDDAPLALPDLRYLVVEYQGVARLAEHCRNSDDRMYERLGRIGEMGEHMAKVTYGGYDIIRLLFGKQPSFRVGNVGRSANWPDSPSLAEVREAVIKLGEAIDRAQAQVITAVIEHLCRILGGAVVRAAEDRRRRGVLEFHDLLVLARRLLGDPEHGAGARAALATRYRRLLLDEFQDTDPIQMDIAELIAAEGPLDRSVRNGLETRPGHLFFVGDAKQSIYRFRRADVALFMQVQKTAGYERVSLTRNFRSVRSVLGWINDLFAGFMATEGWNGVDIQSDYQPLTPVRADPPEGPPVIVLGVEEHPAQSITTGEMREIEGAEVANAILAAVNRKWSVDDGSGGWRPARFEDICVLLPTRTSLPQLEQALSDLEVPYRIEAGSLIWASREIRDLMAIVRALADPTDEVALVNALRSPAFGCGDDDLCTFKVDQGGRWNYLSPLPAGLPAAHPVGEAMEWLSGMHGRCRWLSPSEVIRGIVRDRRLMELGYFGSRRARDVSRSLRLVIEQARLFGESEQARVSGKTAGGLREFVTWVARKISRQDRESEDVLSETDDDAVRITTIHGAKGREFPIVIVSGTNVASPQARVEVIWPSKGGYGVRLTKKLSTATYVEHEAGEELMAHAERIRLLYVALTRARDHLVVSVHRLSRSESSKADPSLAEMVVENATVLPVAGLGIERCQALNPRSSPPRSPEGWRIERDTVLREAGRPLTLAASGIDRLDGGAAPDAGAELVGEGAGLDKDGTPDGGDRPVWRTGRYGTAFGRAVHAALQTVAFDADEGGPRGGDPSAGSQDRWDTELRRIARHQAGAEGVSFRADDVEQRVRGALNSEVVREAAQRRHWRELYVAADVEDRLLEGFIDLLYEAPDGSFVVVDYKTHDSDEPPDLRHKPGYRLQIAAYALMITQATGRAVSGCVFVFLGPDSAHEVAVEDLPEAITEVRQILAADRVGEARRTSLSGSRSLFAAGPQNSGR